MTTKKFSVINNTANNHICDRVFMAEVEYLLQQLLISPTIKCFFLVKVNSDVPLS